MRGFFSLLSLSIILVLLAWMLVNTSFLQRYLLNKVQDLYGQTYNSKLEIESLSGFVPFELTFNSIRVTIGDSTKTDTVIFAEKAFVNVDLLQLWYSKVKVEDIALKQPTIHYFALNGGGNSLKKAFSPKQNITETEKRDSVESRLLLEVYAPSIRIVNGVFKWDDVKFPKDLISFPQSGRMDSIQMKSFIEIKDEHLYVEFQEFEAKTESFRPNSFSFKTQLYIDKNQIEINALSLKTPLSSIEANVQFERPETPIVDFYTFLSKNLDLNLQKLQINSKEWSTLFPQIPIKKETISLSTKLKGNLENIQIDFLNLAFDDAHAKIKGNIAHLGNPNKIEVVLNLDEFVVPLYLLKPYLQKDLYTKLNEKSIVNITGKFNANNDIALVDLTLIDPKKGTLKLNGAFKEIESETALSYNGKASFKDFEVASFVSVWPTEKINGEIEFNGEGVSFEKLDVTINSTLKNLNFEHLEIAQSKSAISIKNKLISFNSNSKIQTSRLDLEGTLDLNDSIPKYVLLAEFEKLNLDHLFLNTFLRPTNLDGSIRLQGSGIKLDDIYGSLSVDITKAIIEKDTLVPHQFYVDLDSPETHFRTFRLTSSFADLTAKGNLVASTWEKWYKRWGGALKKQALAIAQFKQNGIQTVNEEANLGKLERIDLDIRTKNVGLLSSYFSNWNDITVSSRLKFFVETSGNTLLTNGLLDVDSLLYSDFKINKGKIDFTFTSKNLADIYSNSSFLFKGNVLKIKTETQQFDTLKIDFRQFSDSVFTDINLQNYNNLNDIQIGLAAFVAPTYADVHFKNVSFGNNAYLWRGNPNAHLIYTEKNEFILNDIEFRNDAQTIRLNGVLSENAKDSVLYNIRNVDIGELSKNLNLPYDFSGKINGTFQTKTLFTFPQFEGLIQVDTLSMKNRPVGNVFISSRYEPKKDRFDAKATVKLDSLSHPAYWNKNKRGNDFEVTGYVNRPIKQMLDSDTLYHFDIDIREADMWILNSFIPQIYSKIEGLATAKGYFTGGLGWIDFSNQFDMKDVLTVPEFLETEFYMTGPIVFGFHEGVVFKNVKIRDGKGGTGLLNGLIDMNYFGDERSYNLEVDFNKMAFLNNSFSSEVPFYGQVAGTGKIRLTGPIYKPYLYTVNPILTTSNSRLSVPLLDQQKVDSQNRFIEFVENFDVSLVDRNNDSLDQKTKVVDTKPVVDISKQASGKSFQELFEMNLQFIAPSDTKFELVFDPVTGEILTATGGGSLNISLQDQEIKMYGYFDVLGGDYYFVGGDLFTRKFIITDGGTLAWEGDPQNPRVNLTAVYKTRPNMLPISGQDVRTPIDLILKLSGSIEALQNDFYFEVPNTTFQDASINTALRLLNSEDQKLPQATSLLLTGNFFSVNAAGSDGFSNNLQNNATQAGLSQLLSNQINTILNNSISNLDIDLNLNGFDQADLGIALRLFNDRLVLKREGQLVSNETNRNQSLIGDLGASYKISRALSVEVFYRQDPSLGSFSAVQDQAQNVSGVGLQYQIEFTSWLKLPRIFWDNIREFFGFGKTAEPSDTLADTTRLNSK